MSGSVAERRSGHGSTISILLPLRLVSEANAHTHWRERQARAKAQRSTAALVVAADLKRRGIAAVPASGLTVTITRIAPRLLDSDNLTGSAKHTRDGIAEALGVDDRDARVTWIVKQEKASAHGVRVTIEARSVCETCGQVRAL